MTLSDAAVENFYPASQTPFSVAVEVVEGAAHWTLRLRSLAQRKGTTSGPRRLRLAVRRLLELDAVLERILRRGDPVEVVVRKQQTTDRWVTERQDLIRPLLMPLGIQDDLYPFQRRGVAWLLRNDRCLLCDDMGLGKTAQALGGARRLIRNGRLDWCLVVAPRTLIANWKAESKIWAPELVVSSVLAGGAERQSAWQDAIRSSHIVLTSYEQLRDPPEAIRSDPPGLLIADEAHRLRKASSQVSRGIRRVPAQRFWALSGTPVERDAEDIAVLMSLLLPTQFSVGDKHLSLASLRARIRPYLLRRHKDDVLDEMPPVLESTEKLSLNPEQRSAYQDAIVRYTKASHEAGFLPLFSQLRNLCDLDPVTGSSSKLDRIVELLSDVVSAGEKAVVFSYTLEPLRQLQRRLAASTPPIRSATLTGEMDLDDRDDAIQNFKTDPGCSALLASTRVGSEGLTLTEACHVFFVNLWWNPSSNIQARDRVVRIGQTSLVRVKSFVCEQTVESRLTELLEEKTLTFDELVTALTEKTNHELERKILSDPASD
jgi:SNF2 family DNA or RNA helicase